MFVRTHEPPLRRPTLALHIHNATQDDLHRIHAVQEGCESARRWMAEVYAPIAFRYSFRMLRNEQDAHDAAHDAMVKVFTKIHQYNPEWRFTTWVISITRNTCIDFLRKRKRSAFGEIPDIPDHRPGPLEISVRKERQKAVHRALDQLSPLYREVLVLYHFEHLKYREIADLLDVPLGTVMNRIFRARKHMRDYLLNPESQELSA